MSVARLGAVLALVCLATPALGSTKLAGGVQDAGGRPVASTTRRLNGSVSQLAAGSSTSGVRVAEHGFWRVGNILVLAVEDSLRGGPAPPAALEFGPPVPNPTRGSSRFAIALPAPARVAFGVYDVNGRQVAALEPRDMSEGRWMLEWPGFGAGGRPVGPGIYFARVTVDGRVLGTRRVVRVN